MSTIGYYDGTAVQIKEPLQVYIRLRGKTLHVISVN